MNKFKVKTFRPHMSFYISRRVDTHGIHGTHSAEYLHSDGEVLAVREFWPTEEQAQAVLDKFQPDPPLHVWVHGDVFKNPVVPEPQIYLEHVDGPMVCVLEEANRGGTPSVQLFNATFLFNIKDALSDRGLA